MNVVCRSAIIILMSRPQLAVLVLIVYNTTAFALGKYNVLLQYCGHAVVGTPYI